MARAEALFVLWGWYMLGPFSWGGLTRATLGAGRLARHERYPGPDPRALRRGR
jgi:hypothetical protein